MACTLTVKNLLVRDSFSILDTEADMIPIRSDLPKPELSEPFFILLLISDWYNVLLLHVLCIFIVIITMTLNVVNQECIVFAWGACMSNKMLRNCVVCDAFTLKERINYYNRTQAGKDLIQVHYCVTMMNWQGIELIAQH